MNNLVIQAENLGCRRGGRWLWRGLNLQAKPGNIYWLCGANGCGKTSLLRILAGLREASEGQLVAAPCLFLPQPADFYPKATALQNLVLWAALQQLPANDYQQALHWFGMDQHSAITAEHLSAGQRQKMALARLLLADNMRLWLLDEPYNALDAVGTRQLDQLLEKMAAERVIILASHQQPQLPTINILSLEPIAS